MRLDSASGLLVRSADACGANFAMAAGRSERAYREDADDFGQKSPPFGLDFREWRNVSEMVLTRFGMFRTFRVTARVDAETAGEQTLCWQDAVIRN